MKKSIHTLALALFIATTTLVSCKKTSNQEIVPTDAETDGTSVIVKSRTENKEWEAFKVRTDSTIIRNEMRIAELKNKMTETGKSIDSTYQIKIDLLQEKNEEMKIKLDDYSNDATQNWDSFKTEFNHDMDELKVALKNFAVKNKK